MKKHTIKLTTQEKQQVQNITRKGNHNARVMKRAQVLLASHNGQTDLDIASTTGVSTRTVENIRRRFCQGSLEAALYDAPRPGAKRKLTDKPEAQLAAIACSQPPAGVEHWTLELLQQRLEWLEWGQPPLEEWGQKNGVSHH